MNDVTLVLAIYNGLDLTKKCYNHIRKIYPDAPFVIASGGSNDGTSEWLQSLNDENLSYIHDDDKLTFSDNYNVGIKLVDTEKLVLIHNDMVILPGFLEKLSEQITEDTILSYTTIEPPIFSEHSRPGKIVMDFGRDFDTIQYELLIKTVSKYENNNKLIDGASFFMSGYKKSFIDIGLFDGFSFKPVFCEDDDFLIRAKLKGYKLKTTYDAIVYHFVSKTIRFSDDFKNETKQIELNSNRNFIRKWGIPISTFNLLRYWEDDVFEFKTYNICLVTKEKNDLYHLEPFFNKISMSTIPEDYIKSEQKFTSYDLRTKFLMIELSDVVVEQLSPITNSDYEMLQLLRVTLPNYGPGTYETGNFKITIKGVD